jgi:hypothetical protein
VIGRSGHGLNERAQGGYEIRRQRCFVFRLLIGTGEKFGIPVFSSRAIAFFVFFVKSLTSSSSFSSLGGVCLREGFPSGSDFAPGDFGALLRRDEGNEESPHKLQ